MYFVHEFCASEIAINHTMQSAIFRTDTQENSILPGGGEIAKCYYSDLWSYKQTNMLQRSAALVL